MKDQRLQTVLFDVGESRRKKASSSTFSGNMALPVHRWFRYSAGFSATWIKEVIDAQKEQGNLHILDPFAGSGTVLVEAERSGVHGIGIESHPFIHRVAQTKLYSLTDPADFSEFAHHLLDIAKTGEAIPQDYPPLIKKCYTPEILRRLSTLHKAWLDNREDSPRSALSWLALVSILRECSPVGTANWQYVLPKKSKSRVSDPFDAFANKISQMVQDMNHRRQNKAIVHPAKIYMDDARLLTSVPDRWANLVITSPPYPNNFDYADATRLEMSFMGEVNNWGDLQENVRKFLVRSCTQHISPLVNDTFTMLEDERLSPIADEIRTTCVRLAEEREKHGGEKNYHTMIAAYFNDMSRVWKALRRVCASGSQICFVIGDSAPYGVHVPVEKWLGKLAIHSGFNDFDFEKTRDRNVKWKNRKHRVPLHEGRLWVKG